MRVLFRKDEPSVGATIYFVEVEKVTSICSYNCFNKYICRYQNSRKKILISTPRFDLIKLLDNNSVKQKLNRLKNLVVQFIFSIFAVSNK